MNKKTIIGIGIGIPSGIAGGILFYKYIKYQQIKDKPYAPDNMYWDMVEVQKHPDNAYYTVNFQRRWGMSPEEAMAQYRFIRPEEQEESHWYDFIYA